MASKALTKYRPPTADRAIPLDEPINASLAALNRAVGLWTVVEPLVGEYLARFKPGSPLAKGESETERAGKLVAILEKLSRTAVNLIKVTDEAARLRDLLTGGQEVRQDIANLGDRELQDILVETVLARGLWRLIQKRAKEQGVALEAEVISVEKL